VRVVLSCMRDILSDHEICPQTVGAHFTFYFAMCLFPNAERQAQEEIDRVIGGSRLPTLDDRSRLPYVSAILDEVYRWRPVSSLGLSL
jgi:hypothetical protein